jgi:hypothetical protein
MFKYPIKKGGGGIRRVLPIDTITNQSGGMMTKYVAGSGVGASSVAVRRLKLYKATTKQTESSPTVPNTVPYSPTITSATAGYTAVTVFFTAPINNGGSPIISYKVFSNPDNIVITGYSSPITVTGLTNGVTYTFTIVATNANGDSAVSNTSAGATPYGSPPLKGKVQSVVSFFDNADLGYTTMNNTFSRMCIDALQNVLIACYARSGTFTMNQTDGEDGITQTLALTDTFIGNANVTTYYNYNIEVIKYNSVGVPQWVAKIGGDTNNANTIYDIASDSNNNLYALVAHGTSIVTYYNADGSIFGTLNNAFSFGNLTPARYCLVKYNTNGQIQWINTITAGDNNNTFTYFNTGKIVIDSINNVYMSAQVQRAGGGSGPTSIKFYEYTGVDNANQIQFTLATSDSYPFNMPYVDGQWQRGFLIKVNPTNNFDWIARIAIPGAYGEQNSGPTSKNIVIDSNDNIYMCVGTITSASSPICNIYSGVSAAVNPLSALASPYYRLDLRGNSITPPAGQYYKFAAILKFNTSGVFQRASCVHQMHNGSTLLDMNPFIGIDKITNSVYITTNAQGYVGTNAMTGAQLNQLYVNHFSANTANASNYDIILTSAYTMMLTQPQQVMAIVKYDSSLQAQTMAYIDTPGGNTISPVSVDSNSNVYVTTTIRDTTSIKTIYTYGSLSESTPSFNIFGKVNAMTTNTDGLVVCYTGDLMDVKWAAPITSSDGMNNSGFTSAVDSTNNIYIGGTSALNKNAVSNTINLYDYDTVTNGFVVNSLFGNTDVTNATDRTGFIVKYT